MSKENSIKRKNKVDERKITTRKNAKQLIEKDMENKSGLVTTFFRHKQAGFELIGFSRKLRFQ